MDDDGTLHKKIREFEFNDSDLDRAIDMIDSDKSEMESRSAEFNSMIYSLYTSAKQVDALNSFYKLVSILYPVIFAS